MKKEELLEFFDEARNYVETHGYQGEIKLVEDRSFSHLTPMKFFYEYTYVVINSGMKNQVADKIMERFTKNLDFTKIGHPGKREAIEEMWKFREVYYRQLVKANDKLAYLETLYWIGPTTKYHLARNLGLDYAKPDRHMLRIAQHFVYPDIQTMCEFITQKRELRVGTVDVILWRYMNLTGGKIDANR